MEDVGGGGGGGGGDQEGKGGMDGDDKMEVSTIVSEECGEDMQVDCNN